MSTEEAMQQLHSAGASLSETAQKSAVDHDQIISKLEEIEHIKTDMIHWQCETDQGWQEYDAKVTAQLEAAHEQSRVAAFEVNGTKYTGDTATHEQRRSTTPFTKRAMRRVSVSDTTPESKHIMALIQTAKDFAKHQADSSNRLLTDLRHRLTVLASLDQPTYAWECKAETGWIAYSSAINGTIEEGYQVTTSFVLAVKAILSSFDICVLHELVLMRIRYSQQSSVTTSHTSMINE
jgi:WWE domain